jgi:hypothetical protein
VPLIVKLTVSAAVVGAVRVTVKVPVLPGVSEDTASVAAMLTVLRSSSAMVTVALDDVEIA